jgi:uncharacterized membrane protein YdbT with pleckstrin-like domain
MSYQNIWDKTLSSDEKIEHEFSIGNGYVKFGLIVWGIISLPLLVAAGMGIFTFLIALFYYKFYLKVANAYAFTNKRIIIHTGWLSTHMKSVDYSKITDVHVEEPFIDRIITYTGNLAINTAGSNATEIVLKHVEKPYELKKRLDEIIQKS